MSGGAMIEVKCADCYEYLGGIEDTRYSGHDQVTILPAGYLQTHECDADGAVARARTAERRRIREYVTSRIAHCSCCEKVQTFARGFDPSGKRCTCTFGKVAALFNELEEEE